MLARILGPGDFRSMPWKNDRGATTELAREDDPAGAMLWRLSSADVAENSAFSPFPGIDRILMLTDGEGFDLDFGEHGRVGPVERLVPVRFSGDWTTRAENVRGPSRDLNVMSTRYRATARVTVHLEAGPIVRLGDRSLFLAIGGVHDVQIGREAFSLHQSQLLLTSEVKRLSGTTRGSGVLLQIDIDWCSAASAPRHA